MPNLAQSLGSDYFFDNFAGAWFLKDDKLYQMRGRSSDGHVRAMLLDEDDTPTHNIPLDFFQGFGTFAWPRLGYRNNEDGTALGWVERRRGTYRRALRADTALLDWNPAATWAIRNGYLDEGEYNRDRPAYADYVMRPKYVGFRDAVTGMRDGSRLTAALSPDFALVPSSDSRQLAKLLYRNRVVGSVSPNGSLTTTMNLTFNTEE